MSRLSNSPRVQKGAIVAIDPLFPVPTVIAFQYNPATMTRSLKPNMATDGASKAEIRRLEKPPTETISLKAEFDATDGLEVRDPTAVSLGVYPQLSALERLIYPSSAVVIANTVLMALGFIEIIPPAAPMTLFVWGPKRVVPIKLDSLSIEETAYDERLNPIQATADLSMQVLSYADLSLLDPSYYIFVAHQISKEAMSNLNPNNSTSTVF